MLADGQTNSRLLFVFPRVSFPRNFVALFFFFVSKKKGSDGTSLSYGMACRSLATDLLFWAMRHFCSHRSVRVPLYNIKAAHLHIAVRQYIFPFRVASFFYDFFIRLSPVRGDFFFATSSLTLRICRFALFFTRFPRVFASLYPDDGVGLARLSAHIRKTVSLRIVVWQTVSKMAWSPCSLSVLGIVVEIGL